MHPLYTIGINAYAGALRLAALRNPKADKIVQAQETIFDYLKTHVADKGGRWVWIHAASLGEFEQGRPLIERIRAERPDLRILLTFFSPSGYEVRRDYAQADAVSYLPLDKPKRVKLFLDLVKPEMAIFIKYEFWGNYLAELRRRDIPTYIISAIFRRGQIFFRPWGGEFRRMLRTFNRLYVQDEASRRRLASIGIDNVTVAGDTRFDRVTSIVAKAVDLQLIDRFNSSGAPLGTLVAGSTWPPDEDLLISVLSRHNGLKAIFAPHEFDRARLHALEARLSAIGPTQRLSQITEHRTDPSTLRFIIVDSFGLLAALYRKATMAYVGGGFGTGIHNINEAAAYSIPVIFGPRHHKFKEADDLIACGGGFEIDNQVALDDIVGRLSADTGARQAAGQAAGRYIKSSIGATDKIFNDLFKTTPPEND